VPIRKLQTSLLLAFVWSLLAVGATAAAPPDVGVEGPSYAGASAEPTGEKPESKLWFNDGIWWGSLWDTASGRYEIFRLNGSTWASTNIPLDTRSNSRADALWDGTSLYVASHVFSLTPASGTPSNLYKFSYSAATDTYTPAAGWPQQINNVKTETLVIDKDSTGQLWATWVQNDASNKRRVHVNRTLTGDSGWGTPFVVPGTASHTQVANDDISSLIAFGPGKVGVLWSNQRVSPKTFNFIVHDDNAADMTWGASVAITGGSRFGDDHINLKSLHSDGSGRIFAVIKTSNTGASEPLIVVLSRSSGGLWSQRTVWTKGNNLTRPLVLVDTSNGLLHAFASTEGGGRVYYKSATLTGGFPTGLGTVVMADDAQNDINNVTSGKGNVTSTTGLLVLASNQTTQRYWHHFDALNGGGGNATPVCSNRSLTVAEDSAGGDVAPSCTDTDGPSALTYAIASQGTKGVATVTGTNQLHYTPNPDATGADTFTYTAFDGAATSAPATVNVTITPTGGGTPATVSPVADTYVASDQPTVSNAMSLTLRTRTTSTAQLNTYLRFTFSGVGTASGATLRLFVNESSVDAGKLYQVLDDTWSESILYADQPALGPLIVDLGAVTAGAYRDIDVSSYVTADGTYSFAIIGEVNDLARFDSREAANDPLLVVTP
jgi:Bacterial Ig domain